MTKYFKRFGKPVPVPNPDTTPPTTPGSLAASTANPCVLTLGVPSTDNVAVTGYEVSRQTGAGAFAVLPNSPTLTFPFSDSTVVNGTTYGYRVRAFDGAGNFSSFSNTATTSIPSGLAPDTTAPLTPGSAPSLVANGTTSITISMPLVTDSTVNSGSQVVSGMQQYLVKVNGTVVGSPVTQPSASLTFAAGVDIGTPSPAGTDADVTGTYTLTCGGVQWGGTSDQLHLLAGQMNGDGTFIARIVSITSSTGNAFAKGGVIARDGTDPSAQYFAVLAQSGGLDAEFRTPAGVSAGWSGSLLSHALPYYVRLIRSGNTFTAFISSDGSTWGSAILSQVIPMANTVNVGLGCCANTSGDASPPGEHVTVVIDSVTFTAGTAVDFTDAFSGSASPSARLYTYAGVDNAGNISAYSASLSVTPTATSGGTTKFNPGHYLITNGRPNTPGQFSIIQAAINDIVSTGTPGFAGIQLELPWFYMESAAGGNYFDDPSSPNFNSNSLLRQTLAALATASTTLGRDLKLLLYMPVFGSISSKTIPTTPQPIAYTSSGMGSSTPVANMFPDYLINAGNVVGFQTSLCQGVALWRASAMTSYIALLTKYGSLFDSNPHIEMIIPIYATGANNSDISDPTYSVANFTTQMARLQAALSTAWPTTQKNLFIDYGFVLGSSHMTNAQLDALVTNWIPSVSAASNPGFGLGGPDLLYVTSSPEFAPTQGDQILRGLIGTQDYRGIVSTCWEDQANAFNWTNQTAAGTEAYGFNTLQCTHIPWADIPSGESGNPQGEFPAIKAALMAVAWRIHNTKPSSFT